MSYVHNVFFDIDGTIWNTTDVVAKGWQRAVDETGYSKVKITGDLLKKEFGLPMNIIADHVFTDLDDEKKKAELLELCCKYEHEELVNCKKDLSYEGIVEEIDKLFDKGGYQMFVVSNCQKGYIELMLDKLGIRYCFNDFLCFGDTGRPKGETMRALINRWMIYGDESVYIGDTAGDKEAAEFNDARFIYASYGFGNLEGEEYSVSSPSEIYDLIESINEKEKQRKVESYSRMKGWDVDSNK